MEKPIGRLKQQRSMHHNFGKTGEKLLVLTHDPIGHYHEPTRASRVDELDGRPAAARRLIHDRRAQGRCKVWDTMHRPGHDIQEAGAGAHASAWWARVSLGTTGDHRAQAPCHGAAPTGSSGI